MAIKYVTLSNGIPKLITTASTVYDQTTIIGSTITSGTPITLPASGTYEGDELEIYLNGIKQDTVVDYVYVGSSPRTQIQFTYDLVAPDQLRFRKDVA